ncbi:bZIP transcription factor 16-like isoform X2 [Selaginella moellendorffii]|uniref:bZIP transcription factor 16-like isoform X2 n=1 Tax=Selaginella moellendorffii TaxID=88036 RepID=UPI000D1C5BE6|nr:bZIP transcription factor 16-like isoform X2 [Selaginella moellendorffii]|eukprot:XP_024517157.1 bZIP transcription factor 16-like isoform X2 [Selaginella moellendorffii]
MGSGDAATPTKTPKTSTAQPSPPATYPEWAAAFQAYYNSGTPPPGYQPHPYMWGAQPMMPPYGTPPPYGTMYPPYGMPPGPHPYGQYGMPAPGNATEVCLFRISVLWNLIVCFQGATTDTDGKSSDGKERSPMKKSKNSSLGNLGTLNKGGAEAAAKTAAPNGVVSQSGESGSEGSSDGSDEDGDKRNSEQMNAEGSAPSAGQPGYSGQVGSAFVSPGVPSNPAGGKASVGTSLNMGMDYWGSTPTGNQSSGKGKRGSQSMVPLPSGQMLPHGREGVPPELWLQDERELKRQRRKQSNRESARRSRLRKQAECEELAQRVESLTMENMSLRQELEQAMEERNKLAAENAALLEQLQKGGGGSRASQSQDVGNSDAGNHIQGDENGNTDANTPHERNGRVEGENCETIGKAAIEAASRGEAVAAAG